MPQVLHHAPCHMIPCIYHVCKTHRLRVAPGIQTRLKISRGYVEFTNSHCVCSKLDHLHHNLRDSSVWW